MPNLYRYLAACYAHIDRRRTRNHRARLRAITSAVMLHASYLRNPTRRGSAPRGGRDDMSRTRRLAVILAADVKDYSRLDEEGSLDPARPRPSRRAHVAPRPGRRRASGLAVLIPCIPCDRGLGENESMAEILPPEFAREYLAFTRPDKVAAAMAAAAPATSRHRPV